MVIITGATGKFGSLVVKGLLDVMPVNEIGISVRDTEKAHYLEKLGVRVRRGDFGEPDSLVSAFEGASKVLIVSSGVSGDAALEHHQNAIDAAKAAGADHILYTSHMGASATSKFAPMIDHAATEEMLERSGVQYTSLRNGFYAATTVWMLGEALKTGELAVPEDGPVSWTTHADLAAAAVAALTSKTIDGISPPLTATEAIDLETATAMASKITGKEMKRVVMSDEDYKAKMLAQGMPTHVVEISLGIFLASRNGEFQAVDPMLEELIGRKPMSLEEYLQQELNQ
jgi:NAD(P)H dehydrogenase (quinone)